MDSAIIRLTPRPDPVVEESLESDFRVLVQDAFGLRRKQMRRVVRTVAKLEVERAERVLDLAGVDPECRPETLSPGEFARLLHAIKRIKGAATGPGS